MSKEVDSYYFVKGFTKRLVKTWISKEEPPIVNHIVRHPWQLPKLINRNV